MTENMPQNSRQTTALIVAGGSGSRFGGDRPKQFQMLAGKSVLQRSMELFEAIPEVGSIYVVLPPGSETMWEEATNLAMVGKFARIVPGGERRQDSVYNGLQEIDDAAALVAVHDAARPLADPVCIRRAIQQAASTGAAILAQPASDTIKICDCDGRILSSPDRKTVWHAQTPQVFRLHLLRDAYRRIQAEDIEITDDSQAMELSGHPVDVVASNVNNIKITTFGDLAYAEWLLSRR